jgi:hypothetical protein
MLQPATAWITCRQCNASYDSVAKLREHEKTAHRRAGSEAKEAFAETLPPDIESA